MKRFLKIFLICFVLFLIYLVVSLNTTLNKEGENIFTGKLNEGGILLKEPSGKILYNLEYPDWKTYSSSKFHFKVKLPIDWFVKENEKYIYFGTLDSIKNGGIWSISVYSILNDKNKQIDKIVSNIGLQLKDRVEKREDMNNYTKKIVVTTKENPNWFSKTYLIILNGYIYQFSNNSTKKDEKFKIFFESFETIGPIKPKEFIKMDLSNINWVEYKTKNYNDIVFKYPTDFKLIQDETTLPDKNGTKSGIIVFKSYSRKQKAYFSLRINSDGIGIPIDKKYTVINKNGVKQIILEKVYNDQNKKDKMLDNKRVVLSAHWEEGDYRFLFNFRYSIDGELDGANYEQMFKDILTSINTD